MKKMFMALTAAFMLHPASVKSVFAYEEQQAAAIADPAEGWHRLFHEVLVDVTIMGIIFAAITIYYMLKYKRKSPGQVGSCKKLSTAQMWGWALIPAFVFMADDFFLAANTWSLWNIYRKPPAGSYEIEVRAEMWSWNFIYPGGAAAVNELRVPAGKPIVLRMTSSDVVHSLFLSDFKVKEDCMPGRVTYYWFYPKVPGEHVLTCTEYCGAMHSGMYGKVIVMPQTEFDNWLNKETKA